MQFDSLGDFINMGGYGFYVWLSYGASTAMLLMLILSSKANHSKVKQNISQRLKRENKLRQAAAQNTL